MLDLATHCRRLAEAQEYLASRLDPRPEVAVIAGTGLGDLAEALDLCGEAAYESIPHFPVSTVPGHEGRLLWGRAGELGVAVFLGRFHLYEGYTPWEVTFPLRALNGVGLRGVVITNAAGGLNPDFRPGDIMVLRDHVNMMGANPLSGPHTPEWGDRFPDMSRVYDPDLLDLSKALAESEGIRLREGVYVGVHGPSLETPAETRFFRQAGADAIGMSTVQEAVVAVQARLRVLAFSVITNLNTPEQATPTALEDVLQVAGLAAPKLRRLVHRVLLHWPDTASATAR